MSQLPDEVRATLDSMVDRYGATAPLEAAANLIQAPNDDGKPLLDEDGRDMKTIMKQYPAEDVVSTLAELVLDRTYTEYAMREFLTVCAMVAEYTPKASHAFLVAGGRLSALVLILDQQHKPQTNYNPEAK